MSMNRAYTSLPQRVRLELLATIFMALGIIGAILLPADRAKVSRPENLFTLMESDYANPLLCSASAIRVLNGAVKQVARFAGYDEFSARVDLDNNIKLAKVTRYSGDLFSLIDVQFEYRDASSWNEPHLYISESFWERAFGRSSNILGTMLEVNQSSYRIAGITRTGTSFLHGTDIWLPVRSRSSLGGINSMMVIGSILDPARWSSAQRQIAAAIREYLSDQPFFETTGATFVPVVNRLQFFDASTTVAGRIEGGAVWSGS
jgi:hypothetical protein